MGNGADVYFATSCEAEEHGATAATHPLTADAAGKLFDYLIAGSPAADAAHELLDILMRNESDGNATQHMADQIVDWGTCVCERIASI